MTLTPKDMNGGTTARLLFLIITVLLFMSTGFAGDKTVLSTRDAGSLWEDGRVGITLNGLERTDAFPSELKTFGNQYRSPKEGHDFVVVRLSFARIEGVHVTSLGGRRDEKPTLYDTEGHVYGMYSWTVQGIRVLDSRDLSSPSEFVEGSTAMLVFEFPEDKRPARLSFLYYFKETWEGEKKTGRIDVEIEESKSLSK